MLLVAFILFAITAFLGITMVTAREAMGRNPPALLTMIHGLPATAGLTLLLYATFTVGVSTLAVIALILFLVAAAGGVTLNLGYQQRGTLLPRWLTYLHLLLAIAGFILFAIAVFT